MSSKQERITLTRIAGTKAWRAKEACGHTTRLCGRGFNRAFTVPIGVNRAELVISKAKPRGMEYVHTCKKANLFSELRFLGDRDETTMLTSSGDVMLNKALLNLGVPRGDTFYLWVEYE